MTDLQQFVHTELVGVDHFCLVLCANARTSWWTSLVLPPFPSVDEFNCNTVGVLLSKNVGDSRTAAIACIVCGID